MTATATKPKVNGCGGSLNCSSSTASRSFGIVTRGERSYCIMDDDLTDTEIESLINCEKEYREEPERFTPLEDVNWN